MRDFRIVDEHESDIVEIKLEQHADGYRLWVNDQQGLLLRIYRIKKLQLVGLSEDKCTDVGWIGADGCGDGVGGLAVDAIFVWRDGGGLRAGWRRVCGIFGSVAGVISFGAAIVVGCLTTAPAFSQQGCGPTRVVDPYSGRLVTVYIPCERRPRYDEPRSPYDRTYPYDRPPARPPPRWQPWPDYGPP